MSFIRRVTALGVLAACAAVVPVRAATSEEAWRLYLDGDYGAAAAAASDLFADEASRADALSLLGSIAAAQGSYEAAREHWQAAAELGGPAGREAASKMTLLCALIDCTEQEAATAEAVASTEMVPPVAAPAAPARRDPVAAPVAPEEPSEPLRTPVAPPAPQPESAESPVARAGPGLVLVAGRGTPFDEVREAVQRTTDFLRSHGVDAESPTEKIAVVQESEVVLAQLLAAARERGAAGVVLVDARFGSRERVEATCYGQDGAVLLSESVTGGMGLVRPVRMNVHLMERLEEKLAARIGEPCLPVQP